MIGQNHIKVTLQHELETDKLAHAYLFCGPRGLGKTTAARLLAKSLNCTNRGQGKSEPCNECKACQEIMAGHAIDLIEIDAASQTGVDNVRENIIQNSRFTPNVGKYKVFIIDEVHMLSTSSFNALLKTLEEPPAHAIFILCTTEVHKIPETIISRCQRFDFKRVSQGDLVKLLEKICVQENREVQTSVLQEIVRQSDGCVRDAETLLGKILSLEGKITKEVAEIILPHSDFNLVIELLQNLTANQTVPALFLVNRLVEEGLDLTSFAQDVIEILRKILLIKNSGELGDLAGEFDPETEKELVKISDILTLGQIVEWLNIFINLKQELRYSQIAQLPLELAVVKLTSGVTEPNKAITPVASKPAEIKKKTNPEPAKATPEPVLSEEVEVTKGAKAKLCLATIKEEWLNLLNNILERNYPLAALLKTSEPLKFSDNCLEVGIKYQFYADRLHDRKHQQILNEATKAVFGSAINFRGIIKAEITPYGQEEVRPVDNLASQVLEVMGGEVVE